MPAATPLVEPRGRGRTSGVTWSLEAPGYGPLGPLTPERTMPPCFTSVSRAAGHEARDGSKGTEWNEEAIHEGTKLRAGFGMKDLSSVDCLTGNGVRGTRRSGDPRRNAVPAQGVRTVHCHGVTRTPLYPRQCARGRA